MTNTIVFAPTTSIPVLAGLTPVNISLLQTGNLDVAIVDTYFLGWMLNLEGVPKFVTGAEPFNVQEKAAPQFSFQEA